MKSVTIDRKKHLREEPETGHNRWHPDLEPVLELAEGEEVALDTRDAGDGYLEPTSTEADFATLPFGAIHPLTGPVLVKGAQPGDLLEVEFLDVEPQPWAFTCVIPNMGFLREEIDTPFMVHWDIEDGYAMSAQIPGVRIPGAPFMGVSGVAPSSAQVEAWTKREADLADRGGFVLPPSEDGAVPASGAAAKAGLPTMPPRENGGNFDVKQLTKGARLFLPVNVEGALFSTGDAHFAQGDGEVCLTAMEMGATCVVRFRLHPEEAEAKNIRWPRFERRDFFAEPRWAVPQEFIATMGMPIDEEGVNRGEDLSLACRNAVKNMIALLQEHGYTREQAYVLCSVAVDLKINNAVDVPNVTVSAYLPEAIFRC